MVGKEVGLNSNRALDCSRREYRTPFLSHRTYIEEKEQQDLTTKPFPVHLQRLTSFYRHPTGGLQHNHLLLEWSMHKPWF
ncbi:hypothetical protein GOP47_0006052 [Adiantum capillus-veneris]|uniref:Uncharacterized protein n=1 Tax=Adiantum capillus-veneris TaxID=13818 RepID=A0A9D4V2U6_ADICA|nr:hypothetical protein GOP47_0006052 [Adiantum capillus-veneris]